MVKKICPQCNYLGNEDDLICPYCKIELISKCPQCKTQIKSSFAEYCYICGYMFKNLKNNIKKF